MVYKKFRIRNTDRLERLNVINLTNALLLDNQRSMIQKIVLLTKSSLLLVKQGSFVWKDFHIYMMNAYN